MRYAFPLLQCIEIGSLPGYELGELNSKVVLAGEVKRTFSPFRRTNPVLLSSITQLERFASAQCRDY